MPDEVERRDIDALLATRRELGEDYDEALVASFAERVEAAIGERSAAAVTERGIHQQVTLAGAENGRIRQFVLGLISLGVGVPITIVPMVATEGGLPAVVVAWLGIVGVNAAHAAAVNGGRAD